MTSSPDILIAQDAMWTLVLDGIVAKPDGPERIVLMVRDCLACSARRLDMPLETMGFQALCPVASALASLN